MTEDGFFSKFSIITHKKRFVSFIDRKKGGKKKTLPRKEQNLLGVILRKAPFSPCTFQKRRSVSNSAQKHIFAKHVVLPCTEASLLSARFLLLSETWQNTPYIKPTMQY